MRPMLLIILFSFDILTLDIEMSLNQTQEFTFCHKVKLRPYHPVEQGLASYKVTRLLLTDIFSTAQRKQNLAPTRAGYTTY
jgi:hypothetical protein